MSKHVVNIYITHTDEARRQKAEEQVANFLALGWEYRADLEVSKPHQFAVLVWNKDSEPVHPEGYQRSTVQRIHFPENEPREP